ncbi:MAG: hypothetical protein KAJ78_09395, partial [Acidobacteria bacterium]|nr:hypothetical protein [Acidobacteriota bacterium]
MKQIHVKVAIYTTMLAVMLAVLVVPAIVSAQDRLSDFGFQPAPSPSIPSIGPAETQQTLEMPEILATLYTDRAGFDAAYPGLPIED